VQGGGRIDTKQKERVGIYYRARLVSIDEKEGGLSGERANVGLFDLLYQA
jgi:hypothetical protein